MILALNAGTIDEISLPRYAAEYVVKTNPELEICCVARMPHDMSLLFGFRDDESGRDLRQRMNEAIRTVKADGTPAGFNTAFLAALSDRAGVNFEPVSVESSARAMALSSGTVDALLWTRGTYDQEGNALSYPLDRMEGIVCSTPYLIDSHDAVSRAQ